MKLLAFQQLQNKEVMWKGVGMRKGDSPVVSIPGGCKALLCPK